MNLSSLRLLTWGTIAGSVASALLLAGSDWRGAGAARAERQAQRASARLDPARPPTSLPVEPVAAGATRNSGSGAAPGR